MPRDLSGSSVEANLRVPADSMADIATFAGGRLLRGTQLTGVGMQSESGALFSSEEVSACRCRHAFHIEQREEVDRLEFTV